MKKFTFPILCLIMTSCTFKNYYQVVTTKPENGRIIKDKIVFEDSNCTVNYNFWNEGGKVNLSIFNKTQNDIVVNLKKTFFVLNGVAYEYYQNRILSQSINNGTAITSNYLPSIWNKNTSQITGISTSNSSATYVEKYELSIPPNTSINIGEYNLRRVEYQYCDFVHYPSKSKVQKITFLKSTSPDVFSNLITYSIKNEIFRIENRFYVSEITNKPESLMLENVNKSDCGEKLLFPKSVFRNTSPDNFYIKYSEQRK